MCWNGHQELSPLLAEDDMGSSSLATAAGPGASSAAQQDNPQLQHTHAEFTAKIRQKSHSPKAHS